MTIQLLFIVPLVVSFDVTVIIELPTFRLSSRSSTAIEVDEERVKIFIQEFERYIRELTNNHKQEVNELTKNLSAMCLSIQQLADKIDILVRKEEGE